MKENIPCVGPMVIISHPTNISYFNQVCGCSCSWREIEGYVVPVKFKSTRFFDKEFWYEQYGSSGAISLLSYIGLKPYNNPDDKVDLTYSQLNDMIRKGSANWPTDDLRNWYYWDEFCRYMEKELSHIGCNINKDKPSVEAWVHINTKYGEGVLTWDNCD